MRVPFTPSSSQLRMDIRVSLSQAKEEEEEEEEEEER